MTDTVTLILPAVDTPATSLQTPAGRLAMPGHRVPEKRVTVPVATITDLIAAARAAARHAYVPFSKFHVGAALIMADDPEGRIFSGANIENSSYGVCNCGERTALFKAAAEGFRQVKYLAVSTADSLSGPLADRSPCGICRQAIREFTPREVALDTALIFIDTGEEGTLAEVFDIERLLPYGFNFGGPG